MLRENVERVAGDAIHAAWAGITRLGAVGPRHRRARAFRTFGDGSMIAFPQSVLFGEGRIAIGRGTTVGPLASLSAGMPSQADMRGEPIITIGDRCTLGKGIGIVGHERIEIGDDIWTGHYVYVTDQNHGYEDIICRSACRCGRTSRCRSATGAGSDTARSSFRARASAATSW